MSLSLDEIRFKNKKHVLFTKGRGPVDAHFCGDTFPPDQLLLDIRVFKVEDKKLSDNYSDDDDIVLLFIKSFTNKRTINLISTWDYCNRLSVANSGHCCKNDLSLHKT